MAQDRWLRPETPTEAAASASARIAAGYRFDALLRRDRSDGTIEIVGAKDGFLKHYVIARDGTAELVQRLDRPARYRWGKRLIYAGLLTWGVALAAGFVFQPEKSILWIGGPFVFGWLLSLVGALAAREHDVRAYLRSRFGSSAGWTAMPYRLGGWRPRSTPQLEAVKKLADEGEGEAYVRDRGDGTVEVVTTRDDRRYTQIVDAAGVVLHEEIRPLPQAARWSERLGNGGLVLVVLSLFGLAVNAPIALAGIAAGALLWLGGWALRRTQRPRAASGERWYTVDTVVPSE